MLAVGQAMPPSSSRPTHARAPACTTPSPPTPPQPFDSIEACKKAARESGERQAKLEREYPWIVSERAHFGKPGTDYDFAGTDPESAFAEYERAEGRIETLGRKVNKKVMAMFDKAESEYNELKRKRDVVETDKRKIQGVLPWGG